ncbi:sensor histidine kinase [Streptomyces enissocaesilis]|uniref:histidine kinase n=1 Tax=Streptomyces enissocaesilis TaxID=332589 RepID=A0ABN3X0D4_9ACTN
MPAPPGRPVPYREDIRAVRRELTRAAADCLAGLLAAVFVLTPALPAVACATTPLWWWLLPEDIVVSPAFFGVRDWTTALLTPPVAVIHVAVLLRLAPYVALLHARVTLRLLTGGGTAGLAVRLAEVTTSRAEALDAHAAELRRIERALHDGTQNRLVSVRLHLGMVERLLDGDPDQARTLIRLARSQADEALAELRSIVRGMYPPVLADRGLAGAITSLTLRCPVPCVAETDDLVRIPAAVEVAVYYSVAEALTNAVKHGDASQVRISVRAEAGTLHVVVTDDGRGGAREVAGGGLAGIRQRVAAFDGATEVLSPSGGPTTIRMELPCAY